MCRFLNDGRFLPRINFIVFYSRWRYYGALKPTVIKWNEEVALRRMFVTSSLPMWVLCFKLNLQIL